VNRILKGKGSHREIADALLDEHVFNRRAWRVGREILDEYELAMGEHAFIDGASEFRQRIVLRVCIDAMVGDLGFTMQQPELLALQGGETEAQLRPSEQGAQLGLQAVETGGGDERFTVDEIAFERR